METVQGVVPPYGLKETLHGGKCMVNESMTCRLYSLLSDHDTTEGDDPRQ